MSPSPTPRRWRSRLGAALATAVAATTMVATPWSDASTVTPTAEVAVAAAADWLPTVPMVGYHLGDVFGPVPGVTQVDPVGVSDAGAVAGDYVFGGRVRGFLAFPGRPFVELDAAGADNLDVRAIAPDGSVAGTIHTPREPGGGGWIGVWEADHEGNVGEFRRILHIDSSGAVGDVTAMNDRGDMVAGHTVVHRDGSVTELAHPYPDRFDLQISARDINEDGDVVGSVGWQLDDNSPDESAPVLWSGGAVSVLPTIGSYEGAATTISDAGLIGAYAQTETGQQGYLISNGVIETVGTPEDDVWPRDINEAGELVGRMSTPSGPRAFHYEEGELRNLGELVGADLPVRLQDAVGINVDGDIAGDADWQGNATAFLANAVNPVVFVHGAGASRLSRTVPGDGPVSDEGEVRWMACGEDRTALSLWPQDLASGAAFDDIAAFAPLRDETCYGANRWINPALDVYDGLLDHLTSTGYREYATDGELSRSTSSGCDITQLESDRLPNLFTFAYDWRLDNAQSAARLADFMECVRTFWPSRDVNVVTHSMGSLVAQRYLTDAGFAAPVERLITFGAPWLGAPKLVNVLHTGDFAPRAVNGPYDVIKHIVASFPSAHQLMAGPYYHDLAEVPVLREAGWNVDRDGRSAEEYSFVDLRRYLDEVQNPTYTPGTVAEQFQTRPGQTDWRGMDSEFDADVTHFVGLQAGRNTIGTVVARNRVVCTLGWFDCESRDVIEQELVCGDGTVPHVSATRVGRGQDLNAPDAEIVVFPASSTGENQMAEHTGVTSNPIALAELDALLRTPADEDLEGQYRGPIGQAGQDLGVCISSDQGLLAANAAHVASVAPDADHALRYVRLLGGTDVAVRDGHGHVTPADPDSEGVVPGVTEFPSDIEDSNLVTLPMSSTETYRLSFQATGEPLQLELLDGTQQSPTRAVRWTDVEVPEGLAELELRPTGNPTLRVDTDGDGEVDESIRPTLDVSGADAADVTAPEVVVTAIGAGAQRRYAVSATDDASGVEDVRVSTGGAFEPYDGPFTAPAGATDLEVFATDAAGNRSPMTELVLAEVPTTPLTVAERTPPANERGWNDGPVTVALSAQADGGVSSITWSATGAQPAPETTVSGASLSIPVTEPGVTTLSYRATGADGTVEPTRTLVVRIDVDEPSARLLTPVPDGVTPNLDRIAGTAADGTAGVHSVEVELRDARGRSWDGEHWNDDATWLSTSGGALFERRSGNPTGEALPIGGYRLRLRVTDAAGHRTTTEVQRVTVSPDAAWRVTELADPLSSSQHTSASALNDRGVVMGTASRRTDDGPTLRWSGGTAERVGVPTGLQTEALDDDGTLTGSLPGAIGGQLQPVTISEDGVISQLPLGAGHTTGRALGRNDAGVVVGASGRVPVEWDGAGVHALPLPWTGTGEATDVNDAGTIVGWAAETQGFGDGPDEAMAWTEDGARRLGVLARPDVYSSRALAINDLGVAVGWSDSVSGYPKAVVFADGEVRDLEAEGLGTLGSRAIDINDRGQVVGMYLPRQGSVERPFVWQEGTAPVDLNTLLPAGSGWVLETVRDINEQGQIVGFGTLNGMPRGFLLSTVHAPVAEDVAVTTPGREVSIELDGWDADVADQLTAEVVDGPAHGTAELSQDGADGGAGTVRYRPERGFEGEDTFTYRVHDGTFDSNVGTVTVTVTESEDPEEPENVPPTASLAAPTSGEEGTSVTLDASASTDPDGDADGDGVELAWDLDGDGQFDDGTSPTAELVLLDDGERRVSVRATDADGATDVAEAAVTVTNRVPAVAGVAPTAEVVAGTALRLTGTVADAAADTHTATLDPGDGSPVVPVTVTDRAFDVRHTFTTAGTRTMVLTVVDDDGGRATTRVTVTVKPAERVLAPASINVVGSAQVPGSRDQIVLGGLVVASSRSTTGLVGIARTGSTPMALGSVKVTRAGTWTEGGVRYATVIGSGTLGSGRTLQKVTYELTVSDTRTDQVWLTVRDAAGKAVPALSLGGTPPAGGVDFRIGGASVSPR